MVAVAGEQAPGETAVRVAPALVLEEGDASFHGGLDSRTARAAASSSVASGGALLAVMRAVLDGQAPKDADIHHAEGILRMFGLTSAEAAQIARRPLPNVRPRAA